MPLMSGDITQVVNSESSKLSATGTLEPSIRTMFRVRGQGPYSIELPKAGWTADAADKLMQEFASHLVTLRDKYPGA
jgi:hypothetical protein